MMKLKEISSIFILTLSLMGCKVTNMFDMPEQMDSMTDTTEEMNEVTQSMYFQMRSKESRDTRMNEIEKVDTHQSFANKVASAAIYYKSFEYNLWNPLQSKKFKKELMYEATKEFFRNITEFTNGLRNLSDVSPDSDDNDIMVLNALAVTMHEIHSYQSELVKEKKVKKSSMYSMIKEALKIRDEYNNFEIKLDKNDYRRVILNYHDEALALLNYRADMLAAMTLSKISNINKQYSKVYLGIPSLFNKLSKVLIKWENDYNRLERAEKAEVLKWMKESNRTISYIESLGEEFKPNKRLKKVLKKMRFKESSSEESMTNSQSQAAQNNKKKFKDHIEQYIKS